LPDVRNTRVIDIIKGFDGFDATCEIYDPWADPDEVKREYGISTLKNYGQLSGAYDAIVMAVAHREFYDLDYASLKHKSSSVIYDIKGILNKDVVSGRL